MQEQAEMEPDGHELGATRAWAMILIIAICVLIWIANVSTGVDFMKPKSEDLYRWGGNAASAVQAGEWWRLLTFMFLHGGVIHLALNMLALWESGLVLTRLFGNLSFLFVYFCSGLVGGALSLFFSAQGNVSVGASGAIFGVMGALLVAVMRHQERMPLVGSKKLKVTLGVYIGLSLLYGLTHPGIDNAAHIGGLLAGMLCGFALMEPAEIRAGKSGHRVRMLGGLAFCAAVVVAMVQLAPPAKRDMRAMFSDMQTWRALQPRFVAVQKALAVDLASMESGKISRSHFSRLLYEKHIPAIRAIEVELSRLRLPEDEFAGRAVKAQRLLMDASIKWFAAVLLYDAEPSPLARSRMKEQQALFQQRLTEMTAINEEAGAAKPRNR
jgi:rhomboid protease GluP